MKKNCARTLKKILSLLISILVLGIQFSFGRLSDIVEHAIISKIPDDDHCWMMLSSIKALSEEERQYLQPELELLVVLFTKFPDHNWGNYGEWGGWSGYPNLERTPNLRREWGISSACGYNPVSREGIPLSLHGQRSGFEQTIKILFPRIVALFKNGQHGNAVRVIGVISHGIQDAATFPDFQAVHRSSVYSKWINGIELNNYIPNNLGDSPDKAADKLIDKINQMIQFVDKQAQDIRCAMKNNNWELERQLRIECANEASKIVADLIHTSIILSGKKILSPTPFNINLVVNSDVEESDNGEPSPRGWVSHWNDPKDRIGILDWEGRVPRNQNLWRSGRRSLKMMWASENGLEWRQTWDVATMVKGGEYYKASAWAKTVDATGQNILVMEFYAANTDLISSNESNSIIGSTEWSQLEVQAQVPVEAVRMRVVLRSISNEGAVWFDDIEVMRIESELSNMEPVSEIKPEVLMFQLSFDEGKGVTAIDSSIFKNGPNVLISGDAPIDLHTPEGFIGSALKFDGVDDFVECPAFPDRDVHCPDGAMTLSLAMWADDYRDAVIVCKEQYPLGEQTRGYRLELCRNGKLRFTIHTELGKVYCESAKIISKNQWVQVIATRTKKNMLRIYVDNEQGEAVQAQGAFRPAFFSKSSDAPSHLYLGSDTGCSQFFSGKLDEFKVYSKVFEIN